MHKMTKEYTTQVADHYTPEVQPPREQKKKGQGWVGLSDKTMWDWLTLFGTLAIPIVVMCATIVFSVQQAEVSEAQHNNELRIADANRQNDLRMANDQEEENTLAAYLDGITGLLLNNKLGSQETTHEASVVARAKTMIALSRLKSPHRKAMVVRFLYEAHLIIGKPAAVSLVNADLSGVDLSGIDLKGIDLSGTNLKDANFRSTDLRNADLSYTDMRDADMNGADMDGANTTGTKTASVQLRQTQVRQELFTAIDHRKTIV